MFQCRDLFNLPSLSNVKLLCGHDGLNNIIRWAYKAESQSIKNWVKGHELLIISGAIIDKKDFNLSDLILEAIELNLSGALILVGENYIKSLSKSTIKICNQKNFPIFLISWSTPLINVFEELGHAIVLSSGINENTDGLLADIIFGNNQNEESLLLKSSALNYPLNGSQNIFVINLFNISDSPPSKLLLDAEILDLKEMITALFNDNNLKIIVSSYGTNLVGMFTEISCNTELNDENNHNENYENYCKNNSNHAITYLLNKFINSALIKYPYINMNIGIGQTYSKIIKISNSFNEASKCISICTKLKYKNKILSYKDIGILKVFYEMNNDALLKSYRNEILEPLIMYDKKNNSSLIETLRIFLDNDCNIINTSKTMNTHRNTIKYRISRIENILNVSLSNSFTKLNLYNALIIHSFLL